MKHSVLIVDDEPGIRESLTDVLQDEGYGVASVESAEACLESLATNKYDVVLLDIWLPGLDGIQALEKIQTFADPPTVIMISGHGTIETAVRATKLGAFDFIEKPLSIEKTLLTLRHALEQSRLAAQNRGLREELRGRDRIIGGQRPHEGPAPAVGAGGAHQRPGADLRRERHGKGTGGARAAQSEPTRRAGFRGSQLRGDSRRAHRKRTFRTRQRLLYRCAR